MTNDELVAAYARHQQVRNLSPRSSGTMRSMVRAFAREVDRPLLEVTHDDIERWLDARNIQPRTRSAYISYLWSFYHWAIFADLIDRNPTDRVARPKLPHLLPRPIPTPDLEMALRFADQRLRVVLCMGAFGGLRAFEIAKVAVEDLQLWADPPTLRVLGKGNKERLVPVAMETEKALRAYGMPKRGPLFPSQEGWMRPVHRATLTKWVTSHLRSLGIEGYSTHSLRHWFATEMLALTGNLRLVQELMGHAHPSSTGIYTQLRPLAGAQVVRGLSARAGGPVELPAPVV